MCKAIIGKAVLIPEGMVRHMNWSTYGAAVRLKSMPTLGAALSTDQPYRYSWMISPESKTLFHQLQKQLQLR